MKTKKLTFLLVAVSLLSACNKIESNSQDNTDSIQESISQKQSDELICKLLKNPDIKYNTYNSANDEQGYKDFKDALSSFSADLSDKFFESDDSENQNISISPLSIYMALSLAVECTSGTTRDELLGLLDLSYDDVYQYSKTLFEQSTQERVALGNSRGEIKSRELVTNSLWFEKTLPYKQECIDRLANNYYCYSHAVDFKNNSKEIINIVSDFIKEKTYGLIDHKGAYNSQTTMVLLNTLYIKDIWNNEGELALTEKMNFKNSDGSITNIEFLRGLSYPGRVQQFDDFDTFYTKTSSGFKMKFLLPRGNKTVKEVFNKENIDTINKLKDYQSFDEPNNTKYYTNCLFPQFESSCAVDLTKFFKNQYNIIHLFTDADFSSFAEHDMAVSSIIHKTKLKVERKGIEGAAITEMMVGESAILPEQKEIYETFTLDRSFGFILTDPQDVILFSGIVNNIN